MQRLKLVCTMMITLVPCALGCAADFCPGTGAEYRSSTNYMIADSLGQFVVGESRQCDVGADPMDCPYSCAIIEHGFWHADIHVPTLNEIKTTAQNNEYVQAFGKVATAGNNELNRTFYIEDWDRLGGIRVNVGTDTSIHVSQGDMVDVAGMIKTVSGERYIDYPEVITRFPSSMNLRPFFMVNRALGGEGTDVLPVGGKGLNNIGILLTTTGKVTYVDTATSKRFFYVDDGSALSDGIVIGGRSMVGVRVQINNLAAGNTISPPATGDYVRVTGICAPLISPIGISVQIRPRTHDDVLALVH